MDKICLSHVGLATLANFRDVGELIFGNVSASGV